MPLRSHWAYACEMLQLRGTFAALDEIGTMSQPVFVPGQALQVGYVIVVCIAVDMVHMPPLGYGAFVEYPDVPV